MSGARVARYELPGARWYIAICEECCWSDFLSWRNKGWAADAVKKHNAEQHAAVKVGSDG